MYMQKIHLMGITGSGMSGIASLANRMGYEVTGCDLKTGGHDPKHLKDVDLLIVSPAVLYQSKNNPELLLGQKRKIVMTWEEFLATHLAKNKTMIAVSGTHGKSTTTGMVGKLLEDNGFDPLVLIGANVKKWGGNSRFGKGQYFIVEADEFNDNFLHYRPEIIILNNIEFDHPDYFKNREQLSQSFSKFVNNLTGKKILIVNWDDIGVQNFIKKVDLKNINLIKYSRNFKSLKFKLKVLGEHNISNALGVIELGKILKIPDVKIVKSLNEFEGIGRRTEEISKNVFDDYAHHPSAIKTTLSGLRDRYPKNRIWAIIEPHGYSRTKALLKLYKDAMNFADKVLIGPIYKARDMQTFGMSPLKIKNISNHKDIRGLNNVNEIFNIVSKEIKPNDIFIIMGAGNSNQWAQEIKRIVNGYSFKDLTTLKVGGSIKYFFQVSSKEEIVEKVEFAKNKKLKLFIIGGGSDIAASDKKFNGLVLKYRGNTIKFKGTRVTAEAGAAWDKLVELSVSKNLCGIECLSGIPGTVGASPIQNIGAYGQEIADTFESLNAYDIERKKFVKFDKVDCHFGYRESIFKSKKYWQKFMITDVTFKLKKYKDEDLDLQTIRDEILRVRSEKLVDPNEIPNAGSFFKNPIVDLKKKNELEKKYPEISIYPYENKYKVFAGFLIEKAGWKGKELGPVKVSDKHALVLTNPGGVGNFIDIQKLANKIIADVYKKFGIVLEAEVQYINI